MRICEVSIRFRAHDISERTMSPIHTRCHDHNHVDTIQGRVGIMSIPCNLDIRVERSDYKTF